MKKSLLLLPLLLPMQAFSATSWIDWTSTTAGTLDVNGTTVGVTLTGAPVNYIDGDHYYNNTNANNTNTYGSHAPTDLIQANGQSAYTLAFDQTVNNLFMSLVSVGRTSLPVTYDFNDNFTVESFGSNYWGYGGYSVSGDDFTGSEFNGILSFVGAFDSISFSTAPGENWHGFNFGTTSVSQVPVPAAAFLFAPALLGFMGLRRKAKNTVA